jgi:carboxypeptidase T
MNFSPISRQRAYALLVPLITAVSLFFLIGFADHLTAFPQSDPAGVLPDGDFVVRVYYDEIADIDRLADYDLWEYNNLEEQYVLVGANLLVYESLRAAGWRVELDEEVTALVWHELELLALFDGYRNVDELYEDMAIISDTYPSLTELVTYGSSLCLFNGGCFTPANDYNPGFPLKAMRVTNQEVPGPKPIFFLMAGLHSREITTPEIAMRLLDWLVEGYGTNPDATWLVDYHEIWIVPIANPDGHWLVELGTKPPYNGSAFYQRKNALIHPNCTQWPPSSSWQYGVDLNRNHSLAWGGPGSSSTPCAATYRGVSAASEPEVAQLEAWVTSLIPNPHVPQPGDPAPDDTMGMFISLHSYSELVLWPWGYTSSPAPNRDQLKAIGDKLATYNGYLSCQAPLCLYAASGISDDWSYGTLGIASFTYEIGTSFMPPYNVIDDVQWPDNGPSLQYAAKIARTPYITVYGPDALDIETEIGPTAMMTVTAVINDSDNGNNPIATAAAYVATPYWMTGTVTHTLSLVNQGSPGPVEAVAGTIDVSQFQLRAGQNILFVRGQDAAGNWGAVSAAFFEVEGLDWADPAPVTLQPGASMTQTWALTNTTQSPLTWTLSLPPDLTWLEISQASGTVGAGDSTNVLLTYTAPPASSGSYTDFMTLYSSAPQTPETAVPVQMNVIAMPELDWSPPEPVTLVAGTSLTQSWTITNSGLAPLTWTLALPPDLTWLGADPLGGSIAAGETAELWLTYTAPLTPTGVYTGTLTLYSNDANAPETAVPVQMTVEPPPLPLYYHYLPLIRAD